MNPHITVSAPEPYIVHIEYINANSGTIALFINILNVNSFSPLNINIISAADVKRYIGKNDKVANIVIKVNAETMLFWKFMIKRIFTKTDPIIKALAGVSYFG